MSGVSSMQSLEDEMHAAGVAAMHRATGQAQTEGLGLEDTVRFVLSKSLSASLDVLERRVIFGEGTGQPLGILNGGESSERR